MKNLLIYFLFRIFAFFVKILPKSLQKYLGKGFGKLAYFLTKNRRKVAKNNLKIAFGKELNEKEIENLIKKVYINLGFMLVEFILLKKIDKNNYEKYVDVEGYENFKKAFEKDKGVIIYGAHFGNWEWLGSFISLMGFPINAIVQEQHNPYFDDYINNIRENKGANIIKLGASIRKSYSKLKAGECLFVLGDQDARNRGWKLNFFGEPASTYPGVVQFAEKTGALIVPAFLIRNDFVDHKLVFYSPRKVEKGLSEKEKREKLQSLNDLTEKVISENKEQWFWLHKRWKTY
ncbi:MAG: lysophospholipid acyltransferase family protein [Bacillota bacterium]